MEYASLICLPYVMAFSVHVITYYEAALPQYSAYTPEELSLGGM